MSEEVAPFLTGRLCPPGESLPAGVETDFCLEIVHTDLVEGSGRNACHTKETITYENKKGTKFQKD